jgi:amino acid transporter
LKTFSLKRFLFGRPLRSREAEGEKMPVWKALPILSSDALSSVAYATESILLALVIVGYAAFSFSLPIALGIIALIWILVISYRQVIVTYPKGGGAYAVSRENLGPLWSRIAGASLLVDYILTVAVSISAGVVAITSAFPKTIDYKIELCVIFVLIMVWLNLRGISESGTIFSIPTYIFILSMLTLVGKSIFDFLTGSTTVHVSEIIPNAIPPELTWFIILKAFSSGCSAVTGLEAISNAVPHFKDPGPRNAQLTQLWLGILLAVLFSGITIAAVAYHIHPDLTGHTSVLSMIAANAFGKGFLYYVIQISTMLILVLAANTAFNGFPILSSIMAQDKNFPRIFAQRGSRLAYNYGIIVLGIVAIILLLIFDGETELLIPLYAIGVFLSFTLAQTGLVLKWWRDRSEGWKGKFVINGLGAVISFVVLMIFAVTKFMSGAWLVIVLLPLIVFALNKIHQHYESIALELRLDMTLPIPAKESVVIVPIAGIHKVVAQSIGFAKTLSPNVIAFYVAQSEEEEQKIKERWKEWNPGVRLVTHYSHYRQVMNPLIEFIERVDNGIHESTSIMVLLPKFITIKWWHRLLHNQTANRIQDSLQSRRDIVVAIMPYHLHK